MHTASKSNSLFPSAQGKRGHLDQLLAWYLQYPDLNGSCWQKEPLDDLSRVEIRLGICPGLVLRKHASSMQKFYVILYAKKHTKSLSALSDYLRVFISFFSTCFRRWPESLGSDSRAHQMRSNFPLCLAVFNTVILSFLAHNV